MWFYLAWTHHAMKGSHIIGALWVKSGYFRGGVTLDTWLAGFEKSDIAFTLEKGFIFKPIKRDHRYFSFQNTKKKWISSRHLLISGSGIRGLGSHFKAIHSILFKKPLHFRSNWFIKWLYWYLCLPTVFYTNTY